MMVSSKMPTEIVSVVLMDVKHVLLPTSVLIVSPDGSHFTPQLKVQL
jgi:hypothetical protein